MCFAQQGTEVCR